MCAKITPLGHVMACFPVSPRYGKMLSLGHQHQLLPYVIAMVAALSVQEIFVDNLQESTTEAEVTGCDRTGSHSSSLLQRYTF